MARNQELDLRHYVFLELWISFALFFGKDNIVKLGNEEKLVSEEIASTDS